MAKCENLLNRIDHIDDMCATLRNHALGFDMSLDDFMQPMENDEINVNEFLNFSIELAKGGYGLSEYYSINDELVFRYFCMVSLMMTYLTFPKEFHTFTTLDYLCELFDNDYDDFMMIAKQIKSDVFLYYLDKLEEATAILISEMKNTFEVLMLSFIENYTPDNIVETISEIVVNDIKNYIEENTYDSLLIDVVDNKNEKN